MSNEELIGKFGAQLSEAKAKLKTSQAEAQHHQQCLTALLAHLTQIHLHPAPVAPPTLEQWLKDYPSKEDLQRLIAEISAAANLRDLAEKELKQLGVL